MRLIAVLGTLLGMLAAGVMASPASASEIQDGIPVVPTGPFTTNACGFPITVTPVTNTEHSRILSSGQSVVTLFSGSLRVSFKNPQTGKTITEGISGSATETQTEFDTSGLPHLITTVATNLNLLIIDPGLPAGPFGFPAVSVTSGTLKTAWEAHDGLYSVTLNGHIVVNVCRALG
jgi:hypothetical protein